MFNKIAKEVFQILKSYNKILDLYNNYGTKIYEPDKARKMFIKPDNIMLSIVNDGIDSYIEMNLSDSVNIKEMMSLITTLRNLASRNNLLFNIKKFNKQLRAKDFAYQAEKYIKEDMIDKDNNMKTNKSLKETWAVLDTKTNVYIPVSGNREAARKKAQELNENYEKNNFVMELNESHSKMYGTSKTSYQRVGNTKLIIRHTKSINENNIGSRGRNIKNIFIEMANGERLLYPYNHLAGARAMARHISFDGSITDKIGKNIERLSETYVGLAKISNCLSEKRLYSTNAKIIKEEINTKARNIKKTLVNAFNSYVLVKESLKEMSEILNEDAEYQSKLVSVLNINENEELFTLLKYFPIVEWTEEYADLWHNEDVGEEIGELLDTVKIFEKELEKIQKKYFPEEDTITWSTIEDGEGEEIVFVFNAYNYGSLNDRETPYEPVTMDEKSTTLLNRLIKRIEKKYRVNIRYEEFGESQHLRFFLSRKIMAYESVEQKPESKMDTVKKYVIKYLEKTDRMLNDTEINSFTKGLKNILKGHFSEVPFISKHMNFVTSGDEYRYKLMQWTDANLKLDDSVSNYISGLVDKLSQGLALTRNEKTIADRLVNAVKLKEGVLEDHMLDDFFENFSLSEDNNIENIMEECDTAYNNLTKLSDELETTLGNYDYDDECYRKRLYDHSDEYDNNDEDPDEDDEPNYYQYKNDDEDDDDDDDIDHIEKQRRGFNQILNDDDETDTETAINGTGHLGVEFVDDIEFDPTVYGREGSSDDNDMDTIKTSSNILPITSDDDDVARLRKLSGL